MNYQGQMKKDLQYIFVWCTYPWSDSLRSNVGFFSRFLHLYVEAVKGGLLLHNAAL